ncbi:MAG: (d)CMP kinase [Armatimonadetes bacterium]|nr:(d)CMP kinase [Armatimonadota bacterium]
MPRQLSIAIDGPAGSGKTTIAREVARRLGYKYIDTGAMYRAAAWKSLELGIPLEDEKRIVQMVERMDIRFEVGDGSRILADGQDVSTAIRTPEVTRLSSPISAIPGVRRRLVALQKKMGGEGGCVMEGRDIGSVVMPHAEVKVFLTASVEERARRRYAEMLHSGMHADLVTLRGEIEERDQRDSTRAHSPLTRVPDAVEIATDGITIEQVVEMVMSLCRERLAG